MELIRGVRPMTGQDIEQVADLEQVCFSESWSENLIRMGLDSFRLIHWLQVQRHLSRFSIR